VIACEKAGHVRGEKSAMIAHLIGNKACPYASKEAKKVARMERGGGRKDDVASTDADDESEGPNTPAKKRKRIFGKVKESTMNQTKLKVFKGISIPFSEAQEDLVRKQFLRATISANLPFRWTEDAEVIKLFLLFRSAACDIIPSRRVLAGSLLNEESQRVEKCLTKALKGKYVVLA
jgi:hypothetical protein